MTAQDFIHHLYLEPHPEGGFYKETYRAAGRIKQPCLPPTFAGDRHYSTAIYFLLQQGDYSAFHRIKSDEGWHHYYGGTLLIHVISEQGLYSCIRLGKKVHDGEVFQAVVPANCWFASEPAAQSEFVLVGCTVAPGFDFTDFEMANKDILSQQFPTHHNLIQRL